MARKWFVFHLRPERKEDSRPYDKADLRTLYDQVEDWIDTNKRKSSKLQLLSIKSGDGITTWDKLSDNYPAATIRVKLRSPRDATLFNMFFADSMFAPVMVRGGSGLYDPVILPIIRRVMPNIIARDIIGCQPMTGPVAGLYSLKSKYANETKKKQKSKPKKQSLFQKDWEKDKATLMGQLIKNTQKALDDL